MAEYLAGMKRLWNDEPMTCLATVMALIAGLLAIIETATRPWR